MEFILHLTDVHFSVCTMNFTYCILFFSFAPQVSDVFRKAIESVTEEQVQKGSPELKNLYDGLVMTETQLLSVSICVLDRGWADELRQWEKK